jgi:hypothetical protein
MGYAERTNPNSEWNKKRGTNIAFSSQTTQKTNLVQVPTSVQQSEPMVVELSTKNVFMLVKDFLCRMLSHLRVKSRPSPAPTS